MAFLPLPLCNDGASGVWTLAVVCGVALTAALLAATLTHVWTPFLFQSSLSRVIGWDDNRARWQGDHLVRRRRERVRMAEDVRAEMVSTVFQIVAAVGDQVGAGDALVILESMKMEIPVVAEEPGVVSSIDVEVGDVIQQGDLIATIS